MVTSTSALATSGTGLTNAFYHPLSTSPNVNTVFDNNDLQGDYFVKVVVSNEYTVAQIALDSTFELSYE